MWVDGFGVSGHNVSGHDGSGHPDSGTEGSIYVPTRLDIRRNDYPTTSELFGDVPVTHSIDFINRSQRFSR